MRYSIYCREENEWTNGSRIIFDKKYIHFWGYYYYREPDEYDDSEVAMNIYCFAELPLSKFLSMTKDEFDAFLSECDQYIDGMTREEAKESMEYWGEQLRLKDVNMETPCGNYYESMEIYH